MHIGHLIHKWGARKLGLESQKNLAEATDQAVLLETSIALVDEILADLQSMQAPIIQSSQPYRIEFAKMREPSPVSIFGTVKAEPWICPKEGHYDHPIITQPIKINVNETLKEAMEKNREIPLKMNRIISPFDMYKEINRYEPKVKPNQAIIVLEGTVKHNCKVVSFSAENKLITITFNKKTRLCMRNFRDEFILIPRDARL